MQPTTAEPTTLARGGRREEANAPRGGISINLSDVVAVIGRATPAGAECNSWTANSQSTGPFQASPTGPPSAAAGTQQKRENAGAECSQRQQVRQGDAESKTLLLLPTQNEKRCWPVARMKPKVT
jgi:hypothetical protein